MASKKLQVWLPLFFSIVMALGMFIGFKLRENTSTKNFFSTNKKNTLQEILDLVNNKYVDPIKIDSINEFAINEILEHLDPHSIYIPPTDLEDINNDLKGNFSGIGIEFKVFDDTLNVVNVIQDGPAAKAGILVGDKFLKVNDSINLTTKNIAYEKIRTYLRGNEGSKVNITALRNNKQQNFTIVRGTIKVSTVDAAYMIQPTVGYIKLNKFGKQTYEEFMQNLEKLQKQGLKKLIVDLRGNGGGFMNEATDIADEFLDGNKLIVYTQGNKSDKESYNCKRDGLFEKGDLAILVDETSASASEVLTGALQDWDRATIIGRRTFGKGLVQNQFNLSDGGALRLTIAKYYTPLGRNIQKTYSNKTKKQYQEELLDRYKDGEVLHGDSNEIKSRPTFKTPKGHIVYGGGGIIPDIFITADTTLLTKTIKELFSKDVLFKFVYTQYIQNKNLFANIKTVDSLNNVYKPAENEFKQLAILAKVNGINFDKISSSEKQEILAKIKVLMAKQIFQNQGYYEMQNKNDKSVLKALEVLH